MPSSSSAPRGNSGLTSQLPTNGLAHYVAFVSKSSQAVYAIDTKTGSTNRSFQASSTAIPSSPSPSSDSYLSTSAFHIADSFRSQMHTVPLKASTSKWARIGKKIQESIRKHIERITGARRARDAKAHGPRTRKQPSSSPLSSTSGMDSPSSRRLATPPTPTPTSGMDSPSSRPATPPSSTSGMDSPSSRPATPPSSTSGMDSPYSRPPTPQPKFLPHGSQLPTIFEGEVLTFGDPEPVTTAFVKVISTPFGDLAFSDSSADDSMDDESSDSDSFEWDRDTF